ncbi:hypothetical protein [Rhodococcus sp. BP-332]|uniref:hypothetical protein n=1 Tax=Rhodococcus sp. BP-332 TaxID=2739447 RepID=UPI0027DED5B4|nr:hypothetical protein [Rhodococcus sp. BP-332]
MYKVNLKRVDKVNLKRVGDFTKFARDSSKQVGEQTSELMDSASDTFEKLTAKKPDPYQEAVAEYNAAFTSMNDKGVSLLLLRERSTDLIDLVEHLVNSIVNTPKSFETDIATIDIQKAQFLGAEEFARKDLEAARQSAAGATAGFSAGAAVASMAPTAALWVATTFGTASTGTAISALSGAAASNAALAWLGGGAVAAGGGGTAAGGALLALAGPIGWTVAGATLLASIAVFTKSKFDNRDAKQAAVMSVKKNIAHIERMDAQINDLLERSAALRDKLLQSYKEALPCYAADFLSMSVPQQLQLVALVNNTKACAALLTQRVKQSNDDE